jgi:hypothetical protein
MAAIMDGAASATLGDALRDLQAYLEGKPDASISLHWQPGLANPNHLPGWDIDFAWGTSIDGEWEGFDEDDPIVLAEELIAWLEEDHGPGGLTDAQARRKAD